MKTNIKKSGMWWSWDETCDRCGKTIRDEDWQTTKEPDTGEADFCVDCLHYLLNAGISYTVAKQQYKKDGECNG